MFKLSSSKLQSPYLKISSLRFGGGSSHRAPHPLDSPLVRAR